MLVRCGWVFAAGIIASRADEPLMVYPEHTVTAPSGDFAVEQRSGREEPGGWETWIHPTTKGQPDYKLQLWHDGMLDWAGNFSISPNERYLLHIQKTGSGDNYGAVFNRGKDGRFVLIGSKPPDSGFSEQAWDYFRRKTGREARCYHSGIEFVSWGGDGKCVEISLHGTDVYEEYWVDDWKLHYNLETRRFFQTPDQLEENRQAIHLKHRSEP